MSNTIAAIYKSNAYYLQEVSLMRLWLRKNTQVAHDARPHLVVWAIDSFYVGGLDQFWIDNNL